MVDIKKSLNFAAGGLIKQIAIANLFTPLLPYKITFALTYKCNLRCKRCKTWTRQKKDELGTGQIKLIINSMANLRWMHFSGGEIFLREDIEEILNFTIENRRLSILVFPTNGVMTERIVRIIRPLSKKLRNTKLIITCSIDGRKKKHDELRGSDGVYDKCIETFTKLRSLDNINVYLGITASQDNYQEIPHLLLDLQETMPDLSLSELHFNFADNAFLYNNAESNPGESTNGKIYFFMDKLRRKCRKNKGVKTFLENQYFKLAPSYFKNRRSPLGCSALSGSCFIDPFGDVYPCITYGEKTGNLQLSNYDFIKFWRLSANEKINNLRKIIKDRNCPGCWTPCEAYPSILKNLIRL